jgi:hypothetical protein
MRIPLWINLLCLTTIPQFSFGQTPNSESIRDVKVCQIPEMKDIQTSASPVLKDTHLSDRES